ncbi:MAG: response regulator [Candidatus Korobacteraceae bacterium]
MEHSQGSPSQENLKRVLLIDDDPLQLRIRETVLREAGFLVDVATSADAALALLRSEPLASNIGTVVTDHVLTGASGVDVVRELRHSHPRLPVIVITGMPGAEDEYEGLNVQFRPKPCPPAELIALVRESMKPRG